MIKLSPLEAEVLDALYTVRDHFAIRSNKISRVDYRETMGTVRTAIVHLENRRFGCATGRHSGACQCQKD